MDAPAAGFLTRMGPPAVDLFFLMSGFLMVALYRGRFGSAANAADFVWRRGLRLLPLYWLLTTVALALFAVAPSLFSEHKSFEWPWALGIYAFVPLPKADGMFAPIIGAGWTLTYEMLFYVPFAFAMLHRRGLIFVFAFLLTAPLIGWWLQPLHPALRAATNPLLLEFVLGAGIAYLVRPGSVPRPFAWLLILGGIVLAYASMAHPQAEAWRVFAWGVPGILVVAGCVWLNAPCAHPAVKPLVVLGDATYSIYLGHVFALPACVLLLRPLGVERFLDATALTVLLTVLSTAACVVLWVAVEKPMQRATTAWQKRRLAQRATRMSA